MKVRGRKKWYDEQADWVPSKGRQFVIKEMMQKEGPPKEEPKIKTGAEGMERAYQQGDVYGEDEKMYVAGSHTLTDWFGDVTKNF